MLQLSIDRINQASPYQVCAMPKQGHYLITTDNASHFMLAFEKDFLLDVDDCYEFVLTNIDGVKSHLDLKLRDTIIAIVDEFFSSCNNSMLYVCATSDGLQAARNRLFRRWFEMYEQRGDFTLLSTSYTDEEGIKNYISIIMHNASSHADEILLKYMEARREIESSASSK